MQFLTFYNIVSKLSLDSCVISLKKTFSQLFYTNLSFIHLRWLRERLQIPSQLKLFQDFIQNDCTSDIFLWFCWGWLKQVRQIFVHGKGGSRTAATSNMEHFVIIVTGWKPLTVVTKSSILDVAAVLDPPLHSFQIQIISLDSWKINLASGV